MRIWTIILQFSLVTGRVLWTFLSSFDSQLNFNITLNFILILIFLQFLIILFFIWFFWIELTNIRINFNERIIINWNHMKTDSAKRVSAVQPNANRFSNSTKHLRNQVFVDGGGGTLIILFSHPDGMRRHSAGPPVPALGWDDELLCNRGCPASDELRQVGNQIGVVDEDEWRGIPQIEIQQLQKHTLQFQNRLFGHFVHFGHNCHEVGQVGNQNLLVFGGHEKRRYAQQREPIQRNPHHSQCSIDDVDCGEGSLMFELEPGTEFEQPDCQFGSTAFWNVDLVGNRFGNVLWFFLEHVGGDGAQILSQIGWSLGVRIWISDRLAEFKSDWSRLCILGVLGVLGHAGLCWALLSCLFRQCGVAILHNFKKYLVSRKFVVLEFSWVDLPQTSSRGIPFGDELLARTVILGWASLRVLVGLKWGILSILRIKCSYYWFRRFGRDPH